MVCQINIGGFEYRGFVKMSHRILTLMIDVGSLYLQNQPRFNSENIQVYNKFMEIIN